MEDTADSESAMEDVEESTTGVSEKRKKKMGKPKRPCLFCGKMTLKLPLHLRKEHYMEERVKSALKLPKHLRNREFQSIRKDGIFLANQNIMMKTNLSDREKEQQFFRERRHGSKNLVMCSVCHGFYSSIRIHRHERWCSAVEGVERTNIPPAIPVSLVFEENGSEELKEDQVVLTDSEPVLKNVTKSTTDMSEKRKNKTMKPKHPCLFCGKFMLKISLHLRRKHHMEERVKAAVKLPKRFRDRAFNRLIRDGCLLTNGKITMKTDPSDHEKEQQFTRERRHAQLNFVMCSCCLGFYSPWVIQRHKRSCSPPKTTIGFEEIGSEELTEDPVLENLSAAERLKKRKRNGTMKKPKRPCLFCGKLLTKLPVHLKRRHNKEERVKAALKLPKDLRDRAFDEIRRDGILAANEKIMKKTDISDHEKEQQLMRERRHGRKNLFMCSFCHGAFSPWEIHKHKRTCNAAEATTSAPAAVPVSLAVEKEGLEELTDSELDLENVTVSSTDISAEAKTNIPVASPISTATKEKMKNEFEEEHLVLTDSEPVMENFTLSTTYISAETTAEKTGEEMTDELKEDHFVLTDSEPYMENVTLSTTKISAEATTNIPVSPPVSSANEVEKTNELKEDHFVLTDSESVMENVTLFTTNTAVEVTTNISEASPVSSAIEERRSNELKEDHLVLTDSEPVLENITLSTTYISESGKNENKKKPKRPCLFCGKLQSKLVNHLKRKHRMEERVKAALKLPKCLRDRAFERIRKDGIYSANKNIMKKTNISDHDKEQQFMREGRHGSKDLVMCSVCHGFYNPRLIQKHQQTCSSTEGTKIISVSIPVSSEFEGEGSNVEKSGKNKNKKKPKRPCLFCGELQSKLVTHLKRKHHMEERVKAALKLPKCLRDRAFERIRKDGIYLANKNIMKKTNISDHDKEQQFMRERRHGSKDLVMCSVCHGFYNPRLIQKHQRTCSSAERTKNIPVSIPVSSAFEGEGLNDVNISLAYEENGSKEVMEHQVVLRRLIEVISDI